MYNTYELVRYNPLIENEIPLVYTKVDDYGYPGGSGNSCVVSGHVDEYRVDYGDNETYTLTGKQFLPFAQKTDRLLYQYLISIQEIRDEPLSSKGILR